MRVSVKGGVPQFVMELADWSDYSCAHSPASLCLIVEVSHVDRSLIVSAFDPLKGREEVLRTLAEDPAHPYANLELSPDASMLAIARRGFPEIHISLFSLSGGSDREFPVRALPSITGLNWAPDGKGIYCGSVSPQGSALLYVDMKGNARELWRSKGRGGAVWGIPSPDGRYLALKLAVHSSNAWMIEGF